MQECEQPAFTAGMQPGMMAGMQPGMQPGAAGMQPGPQAMQLPAGGMRPPQGMPQMPGQMPGQQPPLQQMGGLPHGMAQNAMPGLALPPGRHSPGAAASCPLTYCMGAPLAACLAWPHSHIMDVSHGGALACAGQGVGIFFGPECCS